MAFRSRLAMSLADVGDFLGPAKALAFKREELEIRRKLAEDNPSVTEYWTSLPLSYNGLGRLQEKVGAPAEALESYQTELAVGRKLAESRFGNVGFVGTVGTLQSRFAANLVRIGDLQFKIGQPALALAAFGEALASRRKLAKEQSNRCQVPRRLGGWPPRDRGA